MKEYKYDNTYLLKKEAYNSILKTIVRVNVHWDQLQIGEIAYINNTENKIKKINESEFVFCRFDDIGTHIENYKTNKSANSIYNKIIKKLDYSLTYAEDRIKLVQKLIDNNQWIYDLMSDTDVIKRVHKKKKDFLAEDQTIDKLFDTISSYINFAKFKNKEDEEEFYKNKKRYAELNNKRIHTEEEKEEYEKLIEYFSNHHHKAILNIKYPKNKEELVSDIKQVENQLLTTEEQKHRQKKLKRTYRLKEIPKGYFFKMYSRSDKDTIPDFLKQRSEFKDGIKFRYCANRVFVRELNKLKQYLGLNIKNDKEREKYINELISNIGNDKYKKIRTMYSELKSNYEIAKEILVDMVKFTKPLKSTTEYDINSDTWYYDSNGNIVEVSKNLINLADSNTYKGLISNYSDLKEKYYDQMHSDIWALLFVFDELLSKTKLNKDERFILEHLFKSYSQKEMIEKYELEFGEPITSYRVSNMINNIIPNKILDTYLDNVEDWLYTYKIRGKFKKCSKCGEIKVLNERNFRRNKDSGDGFRSDCKVCSSLVENPN